MGVITILFIASLVVACIDALVESLFPNVDILVNFSLIRIIGDLFFIVFSFILWCGMALQRLTVGDLFTPLSYLIKMILAFALLVLDSSASLMLDFIVLPFRIVSEIANSVDPSGNLTKLKLTAVGQILEFDLATFTVRIGLGVDVGVSSASAVFQLSLFGCDALTFGKMVFPRMGFVGFHAQLAGEILGFGFAPYISVELESFILNTLDALIHQVGTPEKLFDEISGILQGFGGS